MTSTDKTCELIGNIDNHRKKRVKPARTACQKSTHSQTQWPNLWDSFGFSQPSGKILWEWNQMDRATASRPHWDMTKRFLLLWKLLCSCKKELVLWLARGIPAQLARSWNNGSVLWPNVKWNCGDVSWIDRMGFNMMAEQQSVKMKHWVEYLK